MEKKMSFTNRLLKAKEAENAFANYCVAHTIPFAYSGCENIPSRNNFDLEISRIKTQTGRFVRHWPDFIVIRNGDAKFVEAKNAKTIEKEAYEDYIKLTKVFNINVLIVFLKENSLYICPIEALIILPLRKHKYRIIDGKWVSPRTSANYDPRTSSGSGTDYGYIDFNLTKFGDMGLINKTQETMVQV